MKSHHYNSLVISACLWAERDICFKPCLKVYYVELVKYEIFNIIIFWNIATKIQSAAILTNSDPDLAENQQKLQVDDFYRL